MITHALPGAFKHRNLNEKGEREMDKSLERYVWSIDKGSKIRVREIREYKITYDSMAENFFVTAHGTGFGHGITIFGSKLKDECADFIDRLTIPVLRKDGGTGDDNL